MGLPYTGAGGGSPCRGWSRAATMMGWFNFESVTSQPHHCLTVAGKRSSLYMQKCFSYRVTIYGEGWVCETTDNIFMMW